MLVNRDFGEKYNDERFLLQKIPNSGMAHFNGYSELGEKLHFTVGRLKWLEKNICTPKEKFLIYFTEVAKF